MKDILKMIFACIAIIAGIAAIIKITSGDPEFIVIFISFTFGILAIIWTVMAHGSLSPGSSLRGYTGYFIACLILVLLYSGWNSAARIFNMTGSWDYMGHLFITLAYLVFVAAAYNIYHLGKEFGFQKEAEKIKRIISEKKK